MREPRPQTWAMKLPPSCGNDDSSVTPAFVIACDKWLFRATIVG